MQKVKKVQKVKKNLTCQQSQAIFRPFDLDLEASLVAFVDLECHLVIGIGIGIGAIGEITAEIARGAEVANETQEDAEAEAGIEAGIEEARGGMRRVTMHASEFI